MHQQALEVVLHVPNDACVQRLQVACRVRWQKNKFDVLEGGIFRVGGALIQNQTDLPVSAAHLAVKVCQEFCE